MSVTSMNVTSDDFHLCLMDNLDNAVFFVNHEGNVIHWNRSAEELTGRIAEDIIGKICSQKALLHISADGSCEGPEASPAALTLEDGSRREADVFFRHRRGHLVPAHVRVVPLHDAEGQLAGVVEIMSNNSAKAAREAEMETLRRNSLLDPLTETASRKHLEIRIQTKLEEAKRYGWAFGLVAASINNFEVIRNAHSRQTTDRLIQMAAKTFANTLRTYDAMGRWGADVLLAVVVIKDPEDLKIVGDRVRALVDKSYVTVDSRMLGVTLSVGVAVAGETDTVESLVDHARQNIQHGLDAGGHKALTGESG